jgi:CBS domain-containing protein
MGDTNSKKAGNFLKTIPPFHLLPEMAIQELVLTMTIDHYDKGEIILSPGGPPNEFLFIIQSGGVNFLFPGPDGSEGERLVDVRGEKEIFGFFSLLSNSASAFKIVAEEDTVCYLINKKVFKRLLENYPDALLYFTMGPSKGHRPYGSSPGTEMPPAGKSTDMDSFLFSGRIKEIMHTPVLSCPPEETLMGAARLMNQQKAGSIIVVDQDASPVGIVTDGDLRGKMIAAGLPSHTPVKAIMSHPVQSISPNAFSFEAILAMIRTRFKYLAVMDEDQLVGIVSERDLMISQGNNPVALIKEIQQASTLTQVIHIRKNMDRTLRTLMERGSSAKEICELITLFNDQLTQKIIRLSEEEMIREKAGPPPVPYTWVAFGSEGRGEQTLTTDQDNAIFFEDVRSDRLKQTQQYFLRLAEKIVSGLEQCGFARCTGNIMASNPDLCQPLGVWKEKYKKWIYDREITSQELIIASIFFDLRPIFGPEQFVLAIKETIAEYLEQSKNFIPMLALTTLEHKTPISFFNRLVVEKSGEYKNKLNIKLHGLIPLVDSLRTLSLSQKILKTSTLERIEGLVEKGVLPDTAGQDLREAFNLMMLLRIHHHVDLMNQGKDPDNYINPAKISSIHRTMLKTSFKAIDQVQKMIEVRFGLSALRQR